MSVTVLTTQQLVTQIKAYLEAQLNQITPPAPRAYNTIQAAVLGMIATEMQKYALDRSLANFIITASGVDLDAAGAEYGAPRQVAIACQLLVTLTGTNGTDIPPLTVFVGNPNGLLYTSTADQVIAGGTSSIPVTCQVPGSSGNLNPADTLALQASIAGATGIPTVASVVVTGTDKETDSAYSARLLSIVQSIGGGGNAADYRNWAQAVAGVARAYPYGGLPFAGLILAPNIYAAQMLVVKGSPTGGSFTLSYNGQTTAPIAFNAGASAIQAALQGLTGANAIAVISLGSGFLITGFTAFAPVTLAANLLTGGTNATVYLFWNAPPQRTVYVQCTPSIQPDGIAPGGLLTSVTATIQKNANQQANQPLGLTMDSLWVFAISRTSFYVTVTSLAAGSSTLGVLQAAIQQALTTYFAGLAPFVDGVDPAFGRNDLITQTSVAGVVQSVLKNYGASCGGVGFGTTAGSYLSSYQLGAGELAKLASVTYL
jgi:hypothetical protein